MKPPNKITGPRSPVRVPGFTLEAVERRPCPRPWRPKAGRSMDPRGPWHRPRFVHGPGVLVGPGRGVLLTLHRAVGGPGSPVQYQRTGDGTPRSFLGLIMGVMLQHVQL